MVGNIKFTQNISVDHKILRHLHEVENKRYRAYSVRKCSRYQHETIGKAGITGKCSPFALSLVIESVLITILMKSDVLKLKTGRNTGNKIPTNKQL